MKRQRTISKNTTDALHKLTKVNNGSDDDDDACNYKNNMHDGFNNDNSNIHINDVNYENDGVDDDDDDGGDNCNEIDSNADEDDNDDDDDDDEYMYDDDFFKYLETDLQDDNSIFNASTTIVKNSFSNEKLLSKALPGTRKYHQIITSTPALAAKTLTQNFKVVDFQCVFMEPTITGLQSFCIKTNVIKK